MHRVMIAAVLLLRTPSALAGDGAAPAEGRPILDTPPAAAPSDRGAEGSVLVAGGPRRHVWYIAPTIGVTTVQDDATAEIGLRGAWFVSRRFGIGLAGSSWTNANTNEGRRLEGGYGGVLLHAVLASYSRVNVATQTVLGGGAYCAGTGEEPGVCGATHGFVSSDSTLNLELALSENLRMTLGGGYRMVIAGGDGPLSNDDLRGPVARTSLQVGRF